MAIQSIQLVTKIGHTKMSLKKVAVKLSVYGEEKCKPKFALVTSLEDLKAKGVCLIKLMAMSIGWFLIVCVIFYAQGSTDFSLGECEIVTSCGTAVESDDLLFFFVAEKEPLYVRAVGIYTSSSNVVQVPVCQCSPCHAYCTLLKGYFN